MRPGSNAGLRLRKGTWTANEDMLLKKCIAEYGEGKWHLIPLKAGLNRCRKSCRLRWLNYLRPNIKKGDFGEDEVDLMHRLHKLLGNRWSLIAGRIPGRTANDVKNYWNTHHRSNSKHQKKESKDHESLQDTIVTVVMPQPHSFSKTLNQYMGENPCIVAHDDTNMLKSSNNGVNNNLNMSLGLILSPNVLDHNINEYLDDFLFDDREKEMNSQIGWSYGGSTKGEASNVVEQYDHSRLFDFPIDETIWTL